MDREWSAALISRVKPSCPNSMQGHSTHLEPGVSGTLGHSDCRQTHSPVLVLVRAGQELSLLMLSSRRGNVTLE